MSHSFFQFGWGPCCWIYVSEIPTARLRTLNVAIAAATQWLINFVIARTTLTMMNSLAYVSPVGRCSPRLFPPATSHHC